VEEQLDIFCRVTGLTTNFLSFMLWKLFGSFMGPFNLLNHVLHRIQHLQ